MNDLSFACVVFGIHQGSACEGEILEHTGDEHIFIGGVQHIGNINKPDHQQKKTGKPDGGDFIITTNEHTHGSKNQDQTGQVNKNPSGGQEFWHGGGHNIYIHEMNETKQCKGDGKKPATKG